MSLQEFGVITVPGASSDIIKRTVCAWYGFTKEQLVGRRKTTRLSRARHIAIYLTLTHKNLSTTSVGRLYGNRDHTTVMHSRNRVASMRLQDPAFDAEITALEQYLREQLA